jgi:phosphate ABC transporter permease protein PstC
MTATAPSLEAAAPRAVGARGELKERVAHVVFAAIACSTLVVILLIGVYVFRRAWPAFEHNGLAYFTNSSDPDMDRELSWAFTGKPDDPPGTLYTALHAWPAIYGTLLTTGGAVLLGFVFSLLSAIFVAELAPRRVARVVEPVVRLLATVPSVVWGLFALLVLAPFIADHFVSDDLAVKFSAVVPLQGANVLLGILVLTLMISPIMIAIFTDALRAVPRHWRDGGRALGLTPWRTVTTISIPVIRSALVAGTVLAIGRAIGEAIALSMATGSLGFVPNPLDGFAFFLEPTRPLASSIVDHSEGFEGEVLAADLFSFGAIIFISSTALMVAARIATRPIRKRFGE